MNRRDAEKQRHKKLPQLTEFTPFDMSSLMVEIDEEWHVFADDLIERFARDFEDAKK